jgi:hypothetical protein
MRVVVICQGEEMVVCGSLPAAKTWVTEHGYLIKFITGHLDDSYEVHVMSEDIAEILGEVSSVQDEEEANEL